MIKRTQMDCCGCTACESICPKHCIKMVADDEGFLVPWVNKDKCISCNLCDSVCPMNKATTHRKGLLEAYVVRHKNKEILNNSSSGGFFSSFCEYILNKGGYCAGAVFDESWKVRHILTNNISDIARFRGSKYIQSDLSDIYPQIKNYLIKGILVGFSGTPCQVAGLKSYLKHEYINLITVDLVCHGVSSPLLWDYYLNIWDKDIKKINHRSKVYGYHSSAMQIDFTDGTTYVSSPRTDYFLKSFFCNISSRQTCYDCPFKGIKRDSDFTIWDCWKPNLVKNIPKDDNKGYTNVIVHTKKAASLIGCFPNLEKYFVGESKNILPVNPINMITHSVIPHKERKYFYQSLKKTGLKMTVMKYIPVRFWDKVKERIKKPLSLFGVLYIIKKNFIDE